MYIWAQSLAPSQNTEDGPTPFKHVRPKNRLIHLIETTF